MSNSRKYQRYFQPISKTHFSTSGTIRTQGHVGQTSISRSVTRTQFKGTAPVGNGGNNGQYVENIVLSCNQCSPSLGQSVMTSKGFILSNITYPTSIYNKYCETNGCGVVQTVKDLNQENSSQSMKLLRNNSIFMKTKWGDISGFKNKKRIDPLSSSEYTRTQYLYNHSNNLACECQ